ncbi:hypothetical protein CRENBAI_002672 [Crenichthys baileyi]|uniref:Uncharacterized protein n=1 Tax=Crenichthys baileyi TaxID=28760 RepID=A0AAV9SMJ1_9TELE
MEQQQQTQGTIQDLKTLPGHRYRTYAPEPKRYESHTPTGEFNPRKVEEATPKQHKLHTQAPSTPTASYPHHTVRRDSKARALRNAVPAPAHRRNRADTVEHRAHNRAPDPTPRRDKLTQQEVPGQRQALEAGVPHPAPTTTQTHHIPATETIAQVETLSSSALPSPLSRSRWRHNSQQSSTPPSPPNHSATVSSPSPSVRERETCTSQVTGPGTAQPTAPSKLASPSIKAKSHLTQHCTPPSHDTLAGARCLP